MKTKVLQVRRPNSSAERPYDTTLVPAVAADQTQQGVKWTYYHDENPWVAQVKDLSAGSSGLEASVTESVKHSTVNGTLLCEGLLKVPEDGAYTFSFQTNDKAIVRLHEALLFDADFHYSGNELEEVVYLQKGLHPFKLYFKKRADNDEASIRWEWSHNGADKAPIPETNFFRLY